MKDRQCPSCGGFYKKSGCERQNINPTDLIERLSLGSGASPDHFLMIEAATELRRLHEVNQELLEALKDMLSGWKYIREVHGDLYGVGWDRAELKAQAAIAKAEGEVK